MCNSLFFSGESAGGQAGVESGGDEGGVFAVFYGLKSIIQMAFTV